MNSPFKVHLLNEQGIAKAECIQSDFEVLWLKLRAYWGLGDELANPTREMAIAITKLEEASMFAKKAMAMRPENQKPE